MFPTVTDPENFLGFMKKNDKVPENPNASKLEQLTAETDENKRVVRENKLKLQEIQMQPESR